MKIFITLNLSKIRTLSVIKNLITLNLIKIRTLSVIKILTTLNVVKAEDVSFEEWNNIMATNLNGPFLCSQAAFPALLVAGGSIVNITSISGVRASTLRLAYGTSKAALMHMTKQLAVEYGNQGVRVNAVAPGPVETEMAKLVHSADIRTSYKDAIPLSRYGTVEEIANTVYFLCSPEASYVNGQILAVDGGFDAAGVGLPSLRE